MTNGDVRKLLRRGAGKVQRRSVAMVERALESSDRAKRTLAPLLIWALPRVWQGEIVFRHFRDWERRGLHVTTNHFYSPIPDTGALPEDFGEQVSELPGVEMNEQAQLRLLREGFANFREEFRHFARKPGPDPHGFAFENSEFGGMDALVLYCMVRHFRPKTILEVGSGHSTRVSARAAEVNGDTSIICIEPYPSEALRTLPGVKELLVSPVQEIPLDRFMALGPGDFLFIDSTHVSRAGSDVNYLYLEVLPRLKPGVIVHAHDIFLPKDYPRAWLTDHLLFWNEQYLLHALLIFNSGFEVLFANNYLGLRHPDALKEIFPDSPWWGGGSFWMRRT